MTRLAKSSWLIFLILTISACNQNKHTVAYSPELFDLVNQVAADGYIGTPVIGKGGVSSDAYLRRRKLMATASDKQLKNLVHHESPVVSLTAFQALCEKNDKSVPEILESVYAKEYVQVHAIQGDLSMEMSTLEYAYGYILGLPLPNKQFQNEPWVDYTISPELQAKLKQKIAVFNSSSPAE